MGPDPATHNSCDKGLLLLSQRAFYQQFHHHLTGLFDHIEGTVGQAPVVDDPSNGVDAQSRENLGAHILSDLAFLLSFQEKAFQDGVEGSFLVTEEGGFPIRGRSGV